MPRPSTSVRCKRLCSAASRALTERCPSIQVQKKPWRTRWIPSFRISVEFRFVEFSQSSFECPCPLKDVATAPAVQSRRSFSWNYPISRFFLLTRSRWALCVQCFITECPGPFKMTSAAWISQSGQSWALAWFTIYAGVALICAVSSGLYLYG